MSIGQGASPYTCRGSPGLRHVSGSRVACLWKGLVAVTVVIFWVAATCGTVLGEMKRWKVGEGGLSWKSQGKISAAIDFTVPGAIQIVGFESDDNIVQQLTWIEEYPPDFVAERPEARIWDNVPLKQSNLPIVDGDDTTSTGDRFKAFGVSQEGTAFYFDLGARFPVSRVVFFPRQTGKDAEGRLFEDDFIRGYEVLANDGLDFSKEDRPIYALMKKVEFTRESIAEIQFPLQFIRYLRLNIRAPNPFEIAEFQLFGTGFVPKGAYLSKVIDLGEAANYSRLEWTVEKLRREEDRVVPAPDADAEVSVRMRTGTDPTPQIYYEIVDLFTRELQEVTEAEYNALLEGRRGPIEDDQLNWSLWSSPFTTSGERIGLPGPRRYFQLRITMESHAILDGVRVTSLAVEHAIPPLAQQVIGEISLLDAPRPPGNVLIVPAGVPSTFAYDVIADVQASDVGFDAIRIFTPSQSKFEALLIGDPPVPVVPDSVEEAPRALTLFFPPSHRVTSRSSGKLRIVFEARVFEQGTLFNAEVFDTQTGELPQKVLPGDANPEVLTDKLRVLTSAESAGDLLRLFEIAPRVISPNGDDRNDRAQISYTLVQLVRAVETKVEVFDLTGRRVQTVFSGEAGSGIYAKAWDGRDDRGERLPVGIYVVKVSVHTERGTFVRIGTVAVVY